MNRDLLYQMAFGFSVVCLRPGLLSSTSVPKRSLFEHYFLVIQSVTLRKLRPFKKILFLAREIPTKILKQKLRNVLTTKAVAGSGGEWGGGRRRKVKNINSAAGSHQQKKQFIGTLENESVG